MIPYRFGFALTTALGNVTRATNLRKYAERHDDVECVWAPITHWVDPPPDPRLPLPVRKQLILMREAAPVLSEWKRLDAVMIHAFQLYSYTAVFKRWGRRPLLALSQDYAPFKTGDMWRAYGQEVNDGFLRSARYRIEVACTRLADLYLPWSTWARDMLVNECHVDPDKILVVGPLADLEEWRHVPPSPEPDGRVRVLFVGGDFTRKGGDLVVDACRGELADKVRLDIVTREVPPSLPPDARVFTDLKPNDGRLRCLYEESDVLALPTRADMSSYVGVEAMAVGRPVVSTRVGGIPDIVEDGVTGFLVDVDDGESFLRRLRQVVEDAELRRRMGAAGRARVEEYFSAERNTGRILSALKEAVDERRAREQST